MQFIQAKYYKAVTTRTINGIVIHTMEAPEKGDTAEQIANYFHSGITHPASAHYCIDNNSEVQCVKDMDVAYHAPGVNSSFLGFEHAGYARQTPADWQDPYSQDLLKRSAGLAALKCIQYNIPVVWLSSADLIAGKRGFTSHVNVTNAFHKSTHTDPGPAFPVDQYLQYVRDGIAYFKGNPAPAQPAPASSPSGNDPLPTPFFTFIHPMLQSGSDNHETVKHLQELLGSLTPDGDFGNKTYMRVVKWQKTYRQPATGTADAELWSVIHGTVRLGDKNKRVEELQRSLNINPDGDFGQGTLKAVQAFQAHKGLNPDGVCGPKTWRALFLK